ncbi:MAG TPA: hypothetical protein VMV48_14955 [Gallionellaceae bacterium]|nr:hypothetical protein [Gallionellaceae bacterium]
MDDLFSKGKILGYEFKYTERNLERASDFETKTLLFLLGIDQIKSQVCFLFIDCFNDISGSDKNCSVLWDYQSKGVSNMTPFQIGESLLTLFENYSSELNFGKYALFMPKTKSTYVENESILEFGISNFGKYSTKIRQGLEAEIQRRNKTVTFTNEEMQRISSFLEIVIFVVDRGEKQDYIKNLVSFKDKDLKPKEFYSEIFNEIRKEQFNKKLDSIHGSHIHSISEALKFNKHLQSKEISILVVNRLIGVDLFKRLAIPLGFLSEVSGLNSNDTKDLILECSAKISKAVFDKNNKTAFWKFLEKAMIETNNNSSLTSHEIYNNISDEGKIKYGHLFGQAGIYLISLLQEGLAQ